MNNNSRFHISELVWRIGLGVFVFLAAWLASDGRFQSIDESAMYVAASNLVRQGNPHTNQMGYSLWSIRPGEAVNMLSPDGDLYTKKSPLLIALMTPFISLSDLIPAIEPVAAVLWLGPLLTAITAVLLYIFAFQLDYQRVTATIMTLLFAFGTMALPYAGTVFGELGVSFGLLLALWAAWRAGKSTRLHNSLTFSLWCGTGVALAISANIVYILMAPIFIAVLYFGGRDTRSSTQRVGEIAGFVFPLCVVGISLLLYNYARFGDMLETGYRFAVGQEGFTTPLWWGVLGLTISPARGLLWYSPPILLGIFGWPRLLRRERPLSWLILLVIIAQILLFGLWWEWWGGYSWGPRFLLPIIPYLMIASLPLVQTAVDGNRPARIGLILVTFWGVLVQVLGTAVEINAYEQLLDALYPAPTAEPLRYHHDPALVYDICHSPIIAHGQQLLKGEMQTPWWLTDGDESRQVEFAPITEQQTAGDVIVFTEPELLYEILTMSDSPPAYGLPYNVSPDDPRAQDLFTRAINNADRVWFITQYPPANPDNWYEAALRQEWASLSETWIDDLRLVLFARPPKLGAWETSQVQFENITLTNYRITPHESSLFVELVWHSSVPLSEDYVTFIHLLDGDGNLIAQQDRPPLGGYKPTSQWVSGEEINDRFVFTLPVGTELDELQFRLGWYTWPSLTRLLLRNGDVGEDSLLLPIP